MKNNRKNRALFKIRAKHGRLAIVELPDNFDKENFVKQWKEQCSKGGFYIFNSSKKD